MTPFGESLTRWTVRLALFAWLFAMHARLTRGDSPGRAKWVRLASTVGCALMFVHVAAAFHFYHDWSHARASDATDLRTRQTLGLDVAGGIWFNYAFVAAWLLDVIALRRRAEAAMPQMGRLEVLLHAFMLFIIFNATVVFESGPTRWLGAAGVASVVLHAALRPMPAPRPDEIP